MSLKAMIDLQASPAPASQCTFLTYTKQAAIWAVPCAVVGLSCRACTLCMLVSSCTVKMITHPDLLVSWQGMLTLTPLPPTSPHTFLIWLDPTLAVSCLFVRKLFSTHVPSG